VDAAVGVAKARDQRERQIVEVLGRYGLSYLGNAVPREPGPGNFISEATGHVGIIDFGRSASWTTAFASSSAVS